MKDRYGRQETKVTEKKKKDPKPPKTKNAKGCYKKSAANNSYCPKKYRLER